MSILGQCKLPLIRLRRSCFLCPLYVKVGSLTDCPLRKYHRAFDAYEKRTGETHRLALKRRHSNERRTQTTDFDMSSNLFFTLNVSIGTPPVAFPSQSPFQIAQTSKLITKYTVQIDSLVPDTWISGVDCTTCSTDQPYDFTLSSSAMNMNTQVTTNQVTGPVTGELVTDLINAGGGVVSHDAY
jgi:hypothetical protein